MEKRLFVVILRYLVPIDVILEHRPAHLNFLEKYYSEGLFLVSGPQVPRTGGVIIVRGKSREDVAEIISQDPFHTLKLAEYQIFEFEANRCASGFENFLTQ